MSAITAAELALWPRAGFGFTLLDVGRPARRAAGLPLRAIRAA